MTKNTDIIPFLYGETTIRTLSLNDQPWFIAKDVCTLLGITNNRDAISSLPEDERGVAITDTPSAEQKMQIINEPGLYRLIFKSRKKEALNFQRWVFHEVLPKIRRTGTFGRRERAVTGFLRELLDMGLSSAEATKVTLATFPPLSKQERALLNKDQRIPSTSLGSSHESLLSMMQQNRRYSLSEIAELLPPDPNLPKNSTPAAMRRRVGHFLKPLIEMGHIDLVIINRQNHYALKSIIEFPVASGGC